jgi:hypothetical protein
MDGKAPLPNRPPDSLIAAIVAALLLSEGNAGMFAQIRIREVWPTSTEWRWIGW